MSPPTPASHPSHSQRLRWAMLLLGFGLAHGCVDDEPTRDLPPLDGERFEAEVQPLIAASCATLDCHGQPGRPLRLYSELGLRRQDALRPRPIDEDTAPEPLTAAELADNVAAFAGLVPELSPGGENLLLSKPLAESAGGDHHVGGALFDERSDPGYLCLKRWLTGGDEDDTACAEAQAAVPDPWP